MAVVADDAGQRDGVEVSLLGTGEHSFPLPPKPQGTKIWISLLRLVLIYVTSDQWMNVFLPVAISQVSELSRQQAGQQRSDSASGKSRFRDASHPHVDVVWCPIQELELVSQCLVTEDFCQL